MTGPQAGGTVEEVALEHGALTFTTRGLVCRCGEKFLSVAEYNQHVIRAVLAPTQSRPTVDDLSLWPILERIWDSANAVGLDGWVGPGRGAGEVDDEALSQRERDIDEAATAVLALIPTVHESASTSTPEWSARREDWKTFQREHSGSLASHHGTRSKVRGAFEWGWLLAWQRFNTPTVSDGEREALATLLLGHGHVAWQRFDAETVADVVLAAGYRNRPMPSVDEVACVVADVMCWEDFVAPDVVEPSADCYRIATAVLALFTKESE